MKKLIAIDGNSLMYRAFYAIKEMSTRDGKATNALHGFLSMLLKLAAENPDYMAVAFDVRGKTFRHDSFSEYKATRKPMPDELAEQMQAIKPILRAMNICICECPGFEGDDVLGTLSRIAEKNGTATLIVTGDRDALQLINEHTHVLMTRRGITDTTEFDEAALLEQYGVTPSGIIDLKGLMGDSSDNIPGIPGVGEKTALKLINKYGSLESVLEHCDDEKGALRQKLNDNAELARISYRLATIDTNAPITVTLDDCAFDTAKMRGAIPLLSKYELKSIISRLPSGDGPDGSAAECEPAEERIVIRSSDELSAFAVTLSKSEAFAIHISEELTIACDDSHVYAVSFAATLLEQGLNEDEVFAALKPALESATIKKLTFDAKRLMHVLSRYGIELGGVAFDAMIADYLLHATRPSATLKALCTDTWGEGSQYDAHSIFVLYPLMMKQLEEKALMNLYTDIELPLIDVLYDMERTGFKVDTDMLSSLGGDMSARIGELEAQIYDLAGGKFSILSTKQLGDVLFVKLGLPPVRKTKTGFSTDSDTLEALADKHPIVPLIMEYRFLTKLKSTFIDGLIALVKRDTHRVHTSFNQNVTATGRISSTEPNLQNIPVRTSMGREIRKAFIASDGCVLVGADYSQIELRLLAHIADDDIMIRAFCNNEDIHRRTAAEVFSVPPEEVTGEQRSAAKAVNFGIVYGISDFGLARNLGISRYRANEYINMYKERYKGVSTYMKQSVETARKNGYAVTLFGRRRDLPELKSSNFNTRSFGERVAMNMPIQGSAADIIKLAMVRVAKALRDEGLHARLVLQIHDELIIDCPVDEAERVACILRDCMQHAASLKVPLIADVAKGRSWYDTKG